jgi:hypothetical protein
MKKIITFAVAVLSATVFLAGCAKEEEPEPTTPVVTDPRAAFHGHWYNSENSTQTGAATYYVDITDSTNASYLQLAYLYGYHTKIRATVSGTAITIPVQTVEGNNVSGAGTLTNANQVNMSYWVNQGGGVVDTLSCVLTK